MRGFRIEFEQPPSPLFVAVVVGGVLALGIALAVVGLRGGDERPRLLSSFRNSEACQRDPYASACQPIFVWTPSVSPLTIPRDDGCDEALTQARLRRERGEAPLVTPTLRIDLRSSATWFARAQDARLFAQLTRVLPSDVGLEGIGTAHSVTAVAPHGRDPAAVRVTANCVDPSDGSTWTASVTLRIRPSAAAARREVEAHPFREPIRPLFGDLTYCERSGPNLCLVAIGRVLATVSATNGSFGYDQAEAAAEFVTPIVAGELEATPGSDSQARAYRAAMRLYRRLAALRPAEVALPAPFRATEVEANSTGLNPLRVDIRVDGTSGENAAIHLYVSRDAQGAADQLFHGRLEWGADHPLCEGMGVRASCRARVGGTGIVTDVSSYGNPPVPTEAYGEARELALAAMTLVLRAATS